MHPALTLNTKDALLIRHVGADWAQKVEPHVKAWANSCGFKGESGQICLVPGSNHKLDHVLWASKLDSFWNYADLAQKLPVGHTYRLESPAPQPTLAALAWALTTYRFQDRYDYKSDKKPHDFPRLCCDKDVDHDWVTHAFGAITFVRDLISLPASDLGPEELAETSELVSGLPGVKRQILQGEALLKNNYPAIYAVGKGSERPPCFVHLHHKGPKNAKKVVLVGKGVVFDSGGLDIKSSSNMLLMKKDMGGAAHVLGLAYLLLLQKVPLDLHVMIPAVENSVDGRSYRPGDILKTRKGLTIEIGNTDAEGRVVLADALAAASELKPDLIIDCATLTGAARVALGTELPALFSNNDAWAQRLLDAAKKVEDPLWSMPLFRAYEKHIKSPFADLNNAGKSPYGGAITAALFLEKFVGEGIPWVHLDMMAWNLSSSPGRPEGGEAMGLRALFEALKIWSAE